jgi:hypothetical protein
MFRDIVEQSPEFPLVSWDDGPGVLAMHYRIKFAGYTEYWDND